MLLKTARLIFVVATAVLMIWAIWPKSLANAADIALEKRVWVKNSSASDVELALSLSDWSIDTVVQDGQSWSKVSLPSMVDSAQPGAPQLPMTGALVGVPTHEGLQVDVISAEIITIPLDHPMLPAPTAETTPFPPIGPDTVELGLNSADQAAELIVADAAIYAGHSVWPPDIVRIAETGYLRDQPFAQIAFTPVQYDPIQQQLIIHQQVEAVVAWDGGARGAGYRPNLAPVESLMQSAFINYDSLNRPPAAEPEAHTSAIQAATRAVTPTFSPIKLFIDETGLYRLTYDDINRFDWKLPAIDPDNIQLFHRGDEVAIDVISAPDGSFDATDEIYFYAEAYEDVYVDQNVYWLQVGQSAGRRFATSTLPTTTVTTTSVTASPYFTQTVHSEENSYYWRAMLDALPGEDYWFWGDRLDPNSSLPSTRTYTVTVHAPSANAMTATVRVKLKGYTALSHQTRVLLNGVEAGRESWSGQIGLTLTAAVSQSLLNEGANFVTVEALDSGAFIDQVLVDWIEIEYGSEFSAENNQLIFSPAVSGTHRFTLTDFTTNTVTVLDVTSPHSVTVVSGVTVTGTTDFTATVDHSVVMSSNLYAVSADAVRTPAAIESPIPSNWRDTSHGADYIVITHEDFVLAAQRLADHRASQGLRTAVVDVADLYNEFNDGFFGSDAIRNFLAYAYDNWQTPAPAYVILLGDGSQDYKDNLGSDSPSFIPPKMVPTFDNGETPSDSWYVSFLGDDPLAEMQLGRLSAETITHATTMVDTIIDYESLPEPTAPQALFVADDRVDIFEFNSQLLIDLLPETYKHREIFVSRYDSPTVFSDIQHNITSTKPIVVNYSGHGSWNRWGSYNVPGHTGQRIFTADHTAALANSEAYPFYTIGNCYNGFFSLPANFVEDDEAMAETIQRQAHGGAIAVWADAGLGYTSGQRALMTALYDDLFSNNQFALGNATEAAKFALYSQSTFWEQTVRTFILFGDPVTMLNAPQTPPGPAQVPTAISSNSQVVSMPHVASALLTLLAVGLLSVTVKVKRQSADS